MGCSGLNHDSLVTWAYVVAWRLRFRRRTTLRKFSESRSPGCCTGVGCCEYCPRSDTSTGRGEKTSVVERGRAFFFGKILPEVAADVWGSLTAFDLNVFWRLFFELSLIEIVPPCKTFITFFNWSYSLKRSISSRNSAIMISLRLIISFR